MVLFGLLAVAVFSVLAVTGEQLQRATAMADHNTKTTTPARTLKTATTNKTNKTIRQTRRAQGHHKHVLKPHNQM
jgi:hypothetical protein